MTDENLKIELCGIQSYPHGSGFEVSVKFYVPGAFAGDLIGAQQAVLDQFDGSEAPVEGEKSARPTPSQPTTTDASTPSPSTSRRRRPGKTGDGETTATQASTPSTPATAASGAAARRRPGRPSAASKAAEVSRDTPEKITDEDLSKATSQAAGKHGVPKVMGVLSGFGVMLVNDLPADKRQEFLDQLADL